MSVHAPYAPALQLFLESDEWDVIMPFINYISQAQQIGKVSEQELLAVARRRKLGIAAMKVLGGYPGKLSKDYDRAFRYALSIPGVVCAVIGIRSVQEMKRAIRAANEFRPLTDAEMKETVHMGEEMVRARSPEVVALDWHRKRDLGSADHV
jgi:predicted aldo/keto reductase-like oxidoreductase